MTDTFSSPADSAIDNALADYIAGDASAKTLRMVEAWGAESPANAQRLKESRSIWQAARRPVPPSASPFLARLDSALRQESVGQMPRPAGTQHRRVSVSRRPYLARAGAVASGLLVLVAGGLWLQGEHKPSGTEVERVVHTARGERAQLSLPDGSSVLLAPNSTLRYAQTFGAAARDIQLDGEALFTVTHSEGVPFVVHVAGASARVLGTTFDVRRYGDDSVVRVIVAAGIVAVQARVSDTEHILASGAAATVSASGRVASLRMTDMSAALAWAHGRIDVTAMPLRDVVREIERLYDIDIRLASSRMGDLRFTGIIDQQSASNAMEMLAATMGLQLAREGRIYTLQGISGQ